jgi:acetyl-CoA synthetase (ADP-forming)
MGGRIMRLLLKHGYGGSVFPVNRARATLFGHTAYPSLSDVPSAPDAVVFAVPTALVLDEVRAAAARGSRTGIVVAAKFSDAGEDGAAAERALVDAANAGGMRLVGPNCLGLFSAVNRVSLCSTPAVDVDVLEPGSIGLVSQSGALLGTIFDRARAMGVHFSHGISVGNQADLEIMDFVEWLIDDDATKVICTYVEAIKSPQRFVDLAARARRKGKPWLMVKAGRTEAGSAAAFSHTASIAGSFAALEAVCREENVILLKDIGTMVTLAGLMARYQAGITGKVGIVTGSGGYGALLADAIATTPGLSVGSFSADTRARLIEDFYPPAQAINPVDVGNARLEKMYEVTSGTVAILSRDEETDVLLNPLTTSPRVEVYAQAVVDGAAATSKPAFCVVPTGDLLNPARDVLRRHRMPFTNCTEEALDALAAWVRHGRFRPREGATRATPRAAPLPRGILHEPEAKEFLARYGLNVAKTALARTPEEAVSAALACGYPVVLKIVSPDVVHKTEVGGVAVGLDNPDAVRGAYQAIRTAVRAAMPGARIDGISVQPMFRTETELIVGARRDAQFGPVILVGAGGVLVELLKDTVLARAPLGPADAERILQSLSIWPILAGYRSGRRLDLAGAVDAIVRLSWLASDLGDQDFEMDVNPLGVGQHACCVLDARIRIAEG